MALSRSTWIAWKPLLGLAAVQGAITLCWVVYNLYVPGMLEELGFPKVAGLYLLAIENVLAIAIEPVTGSLSDRQKRWMGLRLPWVMLGAIAAVGLFLVIPLVPLGVNLHWVLPGVLLLWAIAMAVFHSPVLALLGETAMATKLPQAASVLMMTSVFAGMFAQPAYSHLLLGLGKLGAFGLGSGVMLATIGLLSRCLPRLANQESTIVEPGLGRAVYQRLGLITLTGVGIGLGSTWMRKLLVPMPANSLGMMVFTVVQLISLLPVGYLAGRWGNRRCMVAAIAVMPILMLPLAGSISFLNLPAWIGLGITFSFIFNGAIPFALTQVPATRGGLGVGLYFAGTAAAASLVNGLLAHVGNFSPIGHWVGATIAFLGAGLCILLSRQFARANASPIR